MDPATALPPAPPQRKATSSAESESSSAHEEDDLSLASDWTNEDERASQGDGQPRVNDKSPTIDKDVQDSLLAVSTSATDVETLRGVEPRALPLRQAATGAAIEAQAAPTATTTTTAAAEDHAPAATKAAPDDVAPGPAAAPAVPTITSAAPDPTVDHDRLPRHGNLEPSSEGETPGLHAADTAPAARNLLAAAVANAEARSSAARGPRPEPTANYFDVLSESLDDGDEPDAEPDAAPDADADAPAGADANADGDAKGNAGEYANADAHAGANASTDTAEKVRALRRALEQSDDDLIVHAIEMNRANAADSVTRDANAAARVVSPAPAPAPLPAHQPPPRVTVAEGTSSDVNGARYAASAPHSAVRAPHTAARAAAGGAPTPTPLPPPEPNRHVTDLVRNAIGMVEP